MKIGLVGLPYTGKTTVFGALTGVAGEAAGGHGQSHIATVRVPDERVDTLAGIYQPKKTTYAEVVFTDLAVPHGADERKSLDAAAIQAMRDLDALCQVVCAFENPTHPEPPDPVAEIADFTLELALADLTLVERRIERLKKEKASPQEKAALEKMQAHLEDERPLSDLDLYDSEWDLFSGYQFLSRKPRLIVLNVDEDRAAEPAPTAVVEAAEKVGLGVIRLSAQVEAEIAQLEPEEQQEFLASLGLEESARARFIQEAYRMLDLISFLTVGEDECRAWTIKRGTKALKAAGKIHSDIERGFIRAEVTRWEDLVELGSEGKCREAGKLRLEGKEHEILDGDVVHFRFNV